MVGGIGWRARSAVLTACLAALAMSACGSSDARERRATDGPAEEAVLAGGRPVTVGALTVRSARILEAAAGARTSVYAEVQNDGPADHLTSIRSDDAAAGSLHVMRHEDGYMAMEPADSLEVPAEGDLVLEPGGIHGMLEGLGRPLVPGDSVRIVFGFASGTTIDVVVPVLSLRDLV